MTSRTTILSAPGPGSCTGWRAWRSIFYLSLHIWVINSLTYGEKTFNEVMTFLNSPLFKLLEVGLWGVILFHAFNGVRIVIVDFFKGSLAHKKLFVAADRRGLRPVGAGIVPDPVARVLRRPR